MRLPDGTVLMHARAPYDPAKARAYYLKTRKLKGRKPAKGDTLSSVSGLGVGVTPTKTKATAAQKAYAAKRVSDIRERLVELNGKLRKAMAEAREAERKAKKGPTASDKRKAADAAEEYRNKNKQKLANKAAKKAAASKPASDKPKADTVESLQKRIDKTKDALKAAVAKQRSLN